MSLIRCGAITLDDALDFLSSRSCTPSSLGAQLEAAQALEVPEEFTSNNDGKLSDRRAAPAMRKGTCPICHEEIVIGAIVVTQSSKPTVHLRCYGEAETGDALMHVKPQEGDGFQVRDAAENGLTRSIGVIRCLDALSGQHNMNGVKDRPSLARLHRAMLSRGFSRTQGEIVIQVLRTYEAFKLRSQEQALASVYSWAQSRVPDLFGPPAHKEESLAQAFRTGKAATARKKAADLYADCYLAISAWVVAWNRRHFKLVGT